MADQLRVNGAIASWGHVVLKINGERYYGWDSITYGDKRERTKAYGMGRHHAPRGRTLGKYSTDPVKLRGPLSTAQAVREQLASLSADGKSYGNTECEIVIEYALDNEPALTVEIERCVYVSASSSNEESPEVLKEEIEFDPMIIRRNGLTLFDGSQGAP
jgi:hypothetical protein